MKLNVQPFKFKHFNQLVELLESQKYPDIASIQMKTLPRCGFIVTLNKQPLACGFLRRLEPCYAQIDTLVSNGYFGSQVRHEAIKLLVDTLILEAKALKLKGLVCHTSDTGIIARAQSLGFKIVPQTIIALPIT